MHHFGSRSNNLHVDIQDGSALFRHVPSGYGVVFHLPARLAVGFGDSRATESKESCCSGAGDGGVQRDKHCHRLSLP